MNADVMRKNGVSEEIQQAVETMLTKAWDFNNKELEDSAVELVGRAHVIITKMACGIDLNEEDYNYICENLS